MVNAQTGRPLRVVTNERAPAYIRLPVDQLARVRSALDAHGVRYWVDSQAISIDGSPLVTTINLSGHSDPRVVQSILDRLP